MRLDELPAAVGLLEVASTGGALRTVRRATYREVEPPWSLLKDCPRAAVAKPKGKKKGKVRR